MMLTAWRITKKKYRTHAFTGQGAKDFGGRWNPPGIAAIYTADSLSLAILEMLVHLGDYDGIQEYVAVPIRFDDAKVSSWDIGTLPNHWNSHPIGAATQQMGRQWFNAKRHAVLRVPSAVVPQQYNCVLNPLHSDFTTFSIGTALDDPIDMRLIKVQNR